MRFTSILPLALAALTAVGCAGARDTGFGSASFAQEADLPLQVAIEHPGGGEFQSFFHQGSLYVAGEHEARYNLRLSNNTPERLEAVVSVDGRDVISGEVGNFKKQRGYIIEPFDSIIVEGFRTSLQDVAAFRFSGLQESYTARLGTPQNAGVIGVAVFREQPKRQKKQALAVGPGPQPFFSGGDARQQSKRKERVARRDNARPFPSSKSRPPADAAESEAAAAPEPDGDVAFGDSARSAPTAVGSDDAPAGGAFAQPPAPQNELATQFGESTASSVHSVKFKRNRKRKPDAVFTVYYDSLRGLSARGVPIDGPIDAGFAPPPPGFN